MKKSKKGMTHEQIYGKQQSERLRAQQSERMKGRPFVQTPEQEEHRLARLREVVCGRTVSPETRAKMSASKKGIPQDPQHVEKRLEAIRATLAAKKSREFLERLKAQGEKKE